MNPEKIIDNGNGFQDAKQSFPLSSVQATTTEFQNRTGEYLFSEKSKLPTLSKKLVFDYALVTIAALGIALAVAYKAKSIYLDRGQSSPMMGFVFR